MREKLRKVNDPYYPYRDEEGASYTSVGNYIQMEHLGLCRCGDPYSVMVYVRDFLADCRDKKWPKDTDVKYEFLCHWADDRGFTEHGSSVLCSWLTPLGEELLEDIEWCIENEKEEE